MGPTQHTRWQTRAARASHGPWASRARARLSRPAQGSMDGLWILLVAATWQGHRQGQIRRAEAHPWPCAQTSPLGTHARSAVPHKLETVHQARRRPPLAAAAAVAVRGAQVLRALPAQCDNGHTAIVSHPANGPHLRGAADTGTAQQAPPMTRAHAECARCQHKQQAARRRGRGQGAC